MQSNGMNGNIDQCEIIMTRTGTITSLNALCNTAPGGANSRTFTIYKNGLATTMTLTITGTNTTGTTTSNQVSFSQ